MLKQQPAQTFNSTTTAKRLPQNYGHVTKLNQENSSHRLSPSQNYCIYSRQKLQRLTKKLVLKLGERKKCHHSSISNAISKDIARAQNGLHCSRLPY